MFTERMRQLRNRQGFNKRQMAEALRLPYTTYNNYETGAREPNSEILLRIAGNFRVSVDYLLGNPEPDARPDLSIDPILPLTSQEREHIKKHRDLTIGSQATVLDLIAKLYDLEIQAFANGEERDNAPTVTYTSLPISDQAAAAGNGVYLGPEAFTAYMVDKSKLPHGAAFGVPIEGRSMEPKYLDGEIAIISKEYPEVGQVGLFTLDGKGFIKLLGDGELISLNAEGNPPRPLQEDCIPNGRVIGKISWDDVEKTEEAT